MFRLAQFIFTALFFAASVYTGWLTFNTQVWGMAEWLAIAFLSVEVASLFDLLADREDEKKAKTKQ